MQSVLKPKKTPKADLEKSRFLYFEIGLLIALGFVFAAFSYAKPDEEEVYAPAPDSAVYLAQELLLFRPLPDKIEAVATPKVNKTPTKAANPKKPTSDIKPIELKPATVELPDVLQPIKPDTIVKKANTEPLPEKFIRVDKKPQFPGGEAALYDYLKRNINYPDFARKNGYSGTVSLRFVVGTTGKLREIAIMGKGVRNSGLNEEVLRVFASMPLWEPGYRKGQPIDFIVTFPVKFEFLN